MTNDDEREALIASYEGWDFVEVALNPHGASRVIADLANRLDRALRRSEVPEPSAEGWSTEDRRAAEAEAKHRWHVEESRTRTSQRDFDNFNQGCINGFMLGAEWRKLTHPVPEQQAEPSDAPTVQFMSRRGGKSQALIESMLAQANERGIRVEMVYPQGEPSDAQVDAALKAWGHHKWYNVPASNQVAMRSALRAASAVTEQGENR